MKKILKCITLCLIINNAFANLEISAQKDIESIKQMTGCYKVTFRSSETFAFVDDYNYFPKYKSAGLEWIFVDKESPNSIELQHLLINGDFVLKHWRQKWDYQAKNLIDYNGFSDWHLVHLNLEETKNTWTQRVYQVDDSPRYECSAPWIHYGDKNYWECTANAPLPRREFSKRDDYNVLKRTNRHEILKSSHVHDQDNLKVIRDIQGNEKIIAMEKSYNTYEKVDDGQCLLAVNWWMEHKRFWHHVVSVWEEVLYTRTYTKIDFKKDNINLWQKLFALDEKYSSSDFNDTEAKLEITKVILDHIK